MKQTQNKRLFLEYLEERLVPASIFYNGSLTVSNASRLVGPDQHTNLSVVQQTNGTFTVLDGTANQGNYRITGDLTIDGTNRPDNITVTLNNTAGNGSLPGNLTIYGNNGNDTISVDGTVGNEVVRGNTYIDGGSGDDQTFIGQVHGITLRGNATLIGNVGNDAVTFGGLGGTNTVGGSLGIYSTQAISFTNTAVVGSELLTMNLSPTTNSPEFAAMIATYTSSSAGPLTINGGNLGDVFFFDSGTTLRTTVINDGSGTNLLILGATVNGNFTYNAGGGTNNVLVLGTAAIHGLVPANGDLNINLGGGTNNYDLGSSFQVDGNMKLTAGNSDQTVSSFGGTVGGTLTVSWGTGTNDFTLDNGKATFIVYNLASTNNLSTVNITNGATQSNNVTVNVPTTAAGNVELDLNISSALANSVNFATVTLQGGVGGAFPSTGVINVTFTNFLFSSFFNTLNNNLVAGNAIMVNRNDF